MKQELGVQYMFDACGHSLPLEHEIHAKKGICPSISLILTDTWGKTACSGNAEKQAPDRKCRARPLGPPCASRRALTSQLRMYQLPPLCAASRPTIIAENRLQPCKRAPDPRSTTAGGATEACTVDLGLKNGSNAPSWFQI